MNNTLGYVVLRRIHVERANAVSGPMTYGFPAITGILGAIHALGRQLAAQEEPFRRIGLDGVLIACHDCRPLTYQATPYSDHTFNQSRNPVEKSGKTAPIIEEGKCRLTLSLCIRLAADDANMELSEANGRELASRLRTMLWSRRIAGGSVHGFARRDPALFVGPDALADIPGHLAPAFVLMDAGKDLRDLTMQLRRGRPEATALDVLIDLACLRHEPVEEKDGKVQWRVSSPKTGRGWLVPMPLGFRGIAPAFPPGALAHCRAPQYPARYVETVHGLGKWVFPHRIPDLAAAFWRYRHQPENDLYLVTQEPSTHTEE